MLGRQKLIGKLTAICRQLEKEHAVKTIEDLRCALPVFLREEEDDRDIDKDPVTELYLKKDLAACIETVIKRIPIDKLSGSLEPFHQELDRMYNEGDGQMESGLLSLCTVHKSIGLEFQRVYILQPAELKLPNTMAWGQPWEKLQERNIEYVACTRAKSELVFLRNVEHLDQLFEAFEAGPGRHNHGAPGPAGDDDWTSWRQYCNNNTSSNKSDEDIAARAEADPRDVLGVSETATLQEIRSARAKLLKDYHPDKQAGRPQPLSTSEATRKTRLVVEAYEQLEGELAGYS